MANSHTSGEGVLPAGQIAGSAVPHVHEHHDPNLQHHFYDMDQQLEASTLGMWVFLVTEIMFFGGLFMAYILYRHWYPGDWAAASNHLNVWMGGGNTLVLICSSVTMAWAVRCAQIGSRKGQIVNLRYFAGFTVQETAEALGVSVGTIEREWRYIKRLLYVELSDERRARG